MLGIIRLNTRASYQNNAEPNGITVNLPPPIISSYFRVGLGDAIALFTIPTFCEIGNPVIVQRL